MSDIRRRDRPPVDPLAPPAERWSGWRLPASAILAVAVATASAASADVGVSVVTSNATPVAGGAAFAYTITLTNNDAVNPATDVVMTDPLPAGIVLANSNIAIAGTAAGAVRCVGPANQENGVVVCESSSLPATGTAVITLVAQVVPNVATGVRTNTARVVAGGVANSSSVQINIQVNAPLSASIEATPTAAAGELIAYRMTAINQGSSSAINPIFSAPIPAGTTFLWMAGSEAFYGACSASASDVVCRPKALPTGLHDLTVVVQSSPALAPGPLDETFTIVNPGTGSVVVGSATGTTQITQRSDVAISKSDGVATAIPGTSTTYTIVATNAGPSNAPAAVIVDSFPAACTAVAWTCSGASGGSCPAAGAGNLNTAVNLPVGGSVTFVATCTLSPAATGDLSNTATVAPGGAGVDLLPEDNLSTDVDTLVPTADVSVEKTAAPTAVDVGGTVTFTIVVANAGPSDAPGVTVTDLFPTGFQADLEWTCSGSGGATCTAAGTGDIVDIVDLPAGSSVTYVASCKAFAPEDAEIVNTAGVTLPAGVIDPDPTDQEASATVAVNAFFIQEIPTLGEIGLACLALLLAAGALSLLRRRSV